MALIKAKVIAKKVWLWAKKFWWAIVLGLSVLIAMLLYLLTRNGAYVATLLDVLESKKAAHDAEMETLNRIHDTEVAERNKRLKEHEKRMREVEEEFAKRGDILSKEKEAELKRLVDEGYNDPEKLSREIAKIFGLEHG